MDSRLNCDAKNAPFWNSPTWKNWLFSVHVLAYILALFIIVSFPARVDRQETCRKLTGRNLNTLIQFQLNKTGRLSSTTDHTNGFSLISFQSLEHYILEQNLFKSRFLFKGYFLLWIVICKVLNKYFRIYFFWPLEISFFPWPFRIPMKLSLDVKEILIL